MRRVRRLSLANVLWGIGACAVFSACAAMETSMAKNELEVRTQMSETIFLDPVGPVNRTIYIEVRNTSDRDHFDIEAPIIAAIGRGGYRIVDDPEHAHYWLQANVLMVEKSTKDDAQQSLLNGYGGALGGAVAGAAVGAATGGSGETIALTALVGATIGLIGETVGNAMVDDVLYVAVTDVQVVEKAKQGVEIHSQSQQSLTQGKDGRLSQQFQEVTNRKKFRTRVVSTANQANLDYEEAKTLLASGLTRSLANLF